jgi:hypothetical protein
MSQGRSQAAQRTSTWRNDPDIISMETRILPKSTPPTTAPSAPRAMRLFPQVQIPVRNQTSATPECSGIMSTSSQKRPRSSNSSMGPTPSKRHRVDLLEQSPTPKREPDQASDNNSPVVDNMATAATDAAFDTSMKEKANPSYAQ